MRNFIITLLFFAHGFLFSQTPATDFTVTDLFGKEHRLHEYTSAGKFVLVEFNSSTCGPCKSTYPILNEFWENYGCNTGGLVILLISGKYTDSDWKLVGLSIDYDLKFPVVGGIEGGGHEAAKKDYERAYQVWPTTFLINPDNEKRLFYWNKDPDSLPTILSEAGISEKSCSDDGSHRLWLYKGMQSGFYQPGEVVTIEALDMEYKIFSHWSGDTQFMEDSTSSPATFTMPDRKAVVRAQYRVKSDGIVMPRGTGNQVKVSDTTLFYDDGGDHLIYSGNFNGEITFLPDIPNHNIRIEFLEFAVQDTFYKGGLFDSIAFDEWDTLSIFDGNSTAAPLIGEYWGVNSPGVIESSADDGSLTLRWSSNRLWHFEGWKARLTLVPPEGTNIGKTASHVSVPVPVSLLVNLYEQGFLYHATRQGYYTFSLFNTRGKLVHNQSLNLKKGINQIPIPTSHAARGLLLLKVE